MIEEFKEIHRGYKEITSTPHTIDDLRRDIKQLEDEKETLQKRLERQKTRIQKVPAAQIELAKNYRKEVEKEEKLNNMRQDLNNTIHQLEQKILRLDRQIADQRSSSIDQSPEGILKRMEEENQVNGFLVKEKFPKQLNQMRSKLKYYEEVATNKALGQTELANYRAKVQTKEKDLRFYLIRLDQRVEFGDQQVSGETRFGQRSDGRQFGSVPSTGVDRGTTKGSSSRAFDSVTS